MSNRVQDVPNFVAGLLFFGVGMGALAQATSYEVGNLRQMGPGFFPIIISSLLTLLGVVLLVQAVLSARGRPWQGEIRPMLAVSAAIAAFGILLDRVGLVVAVAAIVVISRLAARPFKPFEVGILFIVLVVVSHLVFVLGLGISLGPKEF